jgi:hypothetical protein
LEFIGDFFFTISCSQGMKGADWAGARLLDRDVGPPAGNSEKEKKKGMRRRKVGQCGRKREAARLG